MALAMGVAAYILLQRRRRAKREKQHLQDLARLRIDVEQDNAPHVAVEAPFLHHGSVIDGDNSDVQSFSKDLPDLGKPR